MIKASPLHYPKLQYGLTIVEFLIAITLSLLLLTGITQIFLANKATFNTTDSLSRVEENGRFAMEVLANSIRMAGYADPTKENVPPPFYGQCAAGDSDCISKSRGCLSSQSWCTADGGNDANDRLAIYFDPVDDLDCLGNSHEGLIVNVFWVEEDESNDDLPSLYCRSYNPEADAWITNEDGEDITEQPIAPGVESFQVLFGEHTGASSELVPNRYVTASQVSDWTQVKSVRIGMLIRSGGVGGLTRENRRFSVLDAAGDGLEFEDDEPRMLYTTTVSINNVILTD